MSDGSKYWVYRHWFISDCARTWSWCIIILHGKVNPPIDEFFETPANPNLRGHRFKLRHQLSHLARRKFAFPVRIVEPWHKLPPEVVASASEESFERRLDGVCDTLFVP